MRLLVVAVLAIAIAACAAAPALQPAPVAAAPPVVETQEVALARLEHDTGIHWDLTVHPNGGIDTYLRTEGPSPLKVPPGGVSTDVAMAFMAKYGAIFGVAEAGHALAPGRANSDIVWLQQVERGVNVENALLMVDFFDGRLARVAGHLDADAHALAPRMLPPAKLLAIAEADLVARYPANENATAKQGPNPVLVVDAAPAAPGPSRLVYKVRVEVARTPGPAATVNASFIYMLDAETGAIVRSYDEHPPPPPAPPRAPPPELPLTAYEAPPSLAPLPAPSASDPGSAHPCTEIVGLDNIALTFDGGKTLVRSRTPPADERGVDAGPVTLDTPYALAAIDYDHHLYISVDGGCHWHDRGRTNARHMSSGRHGVAYAWNWNGDVLRVTTRGVSVLKAPCARVDHVEAEAKNERQILLLADCGVFDSLDGGRTWRRFGEPAPRGLRHEDQSRWNVSIVAVAPGVAGRMLFALGDHEQPVFATDDEGLTWTPVMTETKTDLFFEDDGRTAWALAFPTLQRSTDGGRTFTRVTALMPQTANGRSVRQLRGRAPPGALHFSVDDGARSYLATVDKQTLAVALMPLPLESRDCGPAAVAGHAGCKGGEMSEFGTFVPGESTSICLEVVRVSSWVNRM